jgi:lysophospholipase L1-like esterase
VIVSQATREAVPDEVEIRSEPREPVADATLGIPVAVDFEGQPRHRLVAIGDSLTQGFQSGAISSTHLSFPAIVAYELGWYHHFRRPVYLGFGGLPINIEYLVRELERRYGDRLSWWELAPALFAVRHLMAEIEDWWERGPGSQPPNRTGINHNLGVWGWDLRDVLSGTARKCLEEIEQPTDALVSQVVENANQRTALKVLPIGEGRQDMTVLDAARELGEAGVIESAGSGDGIETLLVWIGANNALQAVLNLEVVWSKEGFQDPHGKGAFTVWRPSHFRAELDELVQKVREIRARHVIWATVPHVTVAPIARGVGRKVRPGSRYFPYYTRPWIADRDFDEARDPSISETEARAIDSAIDQYNDAIEEAVSKARADGSDWRIVDIAGVLDRVAARRYLEDPAARPSWWRKLELPSELGSLSPEPDSRFFATDGARRVAGGLFSLDGVHPTTVGYGVVAQEVINAMTEAGVRFFAPDGITERRGPVRVDMRRLLRLDTLIKDPPGSVTADLGLIGWVDEALDLFGRMLRMGT